MNNFVKLKQTLPKKYCFDEYVKTALLEYCYNISKLDKNYIETVAENWGKNNIRTKQDLDKFFQKCENIKFLATRISRIIGRKVTEYEKIYIEKWLYNYGIKGEKIIELMKENKDFNKINEIVIKERIEN